MAWAGSRKRGARQQCVPRTARFSSTGRRQGRRTGQRRSWPRSIPSNGRSRSLASGPVCVLAGAGTGKTRAVAHRIAYLAATGQISPGRVLAVTFTTRAAGELRGRLRQLGALVPGPAWSRCRRARSTRRRCVSSPTSGRRRSAGSRRGCWSPRSACWPRRRGGSGVGRADRAAGRGRGDRVGQGHPGAAGRLRDGQQQRGPVRPVRRRDARPALRRIRGAANRAQPRGLRVGAGTDRGHRRRATRRPPARSGTGTRSSSWTSTRT